MNRKEREVKVIVEIAFAAILIASIFAIVAPTTMAGMNGGFSPDEEPASSIRIYGDVQPQGNAPEQYVTYKEPFDPTVIPTDSITYNPAIIEESRQPDEPYYGVIIGKGSSSENAREKIFLRSWYEPCGQYNGPGEDDTHPTINLEYTYMLMNTLYLPITGTAPNTQFLIPTCEIDTQTGLGAWLKGTADINLTTVASISGPAVAPSGETVLGQISLEKRLALQEGDKVQFFDHTVELTNITASGEFVIKVAYAGNAQDDSEKGGVSLEDGETIYFDRHNNEYTTANHDATAGHIRTWYVSRDTDILIVGKELHWSDVFYVDAVRYEVTAVEVVDTEGGDGEVDAFKYITLRTKLPKGVGSVRDESVVSSQFIDCIEPAELIPLLPPFNTIHDMVDDIDIPLWDKKDLPEREYTMQGLNYKKLDSDGDMGSPDDNKHWIAYDVNERVIDNVDPLELTYIAGEVEERFSTDLLEKLREDWEVGGLITESWTNFDIQSLPDQYTEFVLPALPDYYTIPDFSWPVALDGDYLITTSLIAPQATGDLYDHKRGTIPGDPSEQRVAFSYDPKDGEDGNDFYVYYDAEIRVGTLKIYGNGSDSTFGITNSCNIEQYENWEEPFNPTAIRTASITFDAAILQYSPEYPMEAQNENVDLKEYLRVWYVPEYEFYGWHEMIGLAPAIVIETTYMLIDSQDKKPWHADVDSWFPFPIVSDPTTSQIGLDSFENAGVESVKENLVRLASLSCNVPDIREGLLPKTTNGTIRIEKTYTMEEGDEVQFIDHSLLFNGYDISDSYPLVTLSYCGNTEDDAINNVYLTNNNNTFFDRHNSPVGNTPSHPDRTWYARYEGRLNATDKARITVGKELQRGDIFYVDGVRYEIPAIEVLDNNGNRDDGCEKFKYITLRTPLPKYLGDGEHTLGQQYLPCADSQWLTKVKPCYPLLALPVLPPLSMEGHEIVDDTDVVLWQPLKLLDKWPYGDIDTGNAGTEYFPCAERYLTMQYPPAAWLEYFRAVPIDTDGDMSTSIPSDWQLWDDYGGPFYPGDVTVAVPDGWQCCECGIPMPLPDTFTVFDREHWIANDVDERIIGPVDPLEFCWKEERPEPRYSTNLLELLDEDGLIETWTKFDIRTIPDEYTRFKVQEIPSLNPRVYVGGEYQLTFEPDIRFDPLSLARPGCYLITTSFFAPNAKGDLNREHSYSVRDRFAFTYNPAEGTGIYMNKDPVIPTMLTIVSYTISNTTIKPPQTTAIDVEFSESVSYKIAIENATSTIYDWTGNAKDPAPKLWDGTYEANGTVVPVGDYTVNVTGTNTTNGKSVTDTSKVITVVGDEVYGVDLNVDISEQTVAPNVTATYTLKVKNTGNVADNYTLFFTNENNAAIVYFNKWPITNLAAGASENVLLNVSNATEGTFVVDVTVTSEKGGAGVYDMITTTTTVQNVPLIVSYTISNRTIKPPQTTAIDVTFSEWVSYKIAIENATCTIYDWTGNAKDTQAKVWDGTYEANGTVVPVGDYTVNVTGTNTTTGLSVVNNTEIITVTSTKLLVGQGAPTEAIKNHFIAAYNRNGGLLVLGNPTTAVHKAWGYWVQDFPGALGYAGGIIMYNPYSDYAYYIHGAIWDRYYNLGGPNAKTDIEFVLGPPISDIGPYVHTLPPEVSSHGTQFRYQNFEGGALDLNVDTGAVFEVHGAIFTKWRALGYAADDLGLVMSDEREAAISAIGTTGRVSDFEGGHIHWHRNGPNANTAFETHGAIDVVYCSEGGSGGWLGFPVSDEYVNPSGYAQSDFEGGYITTTDGVIYEAFGKEDYSVGQGAPTEAIKNHFIDAYNRNGGLPVLDNPSTAVHKAWGYWVQDFPGASGYAGGIIMYNPYKDYAYYIHGAIWDRYYTLGGPNAKTDIEFVLGPPISDIGPCVHTLPPEVSSHGTQFRYQNFEGGALDLNVDTGAVFEVHGAIFTKWKGLGYAAGDLGLVTSDEREAVTSAIGTEGRVSDFEGGHIHWHRNGALANTAFETHGAIDVVYCSEGGSGSWLGFPVSDEYVNPSGHAQSDFEGGYITTTDGVNYYVYMYDDNEGPALEITFPWDGFHTDEYRISISGTAYDVSGILYDKVAIASSGFAAAPKTARCDPITHEWNTNIPLVHGNNVIKVVAWDNKHNPTGKTIVVYCNPPDFSFAHVTDAHIGALFADRKLKDIVYELNNIYYLKHHPKPKFVLVPGDIVDYDDKKLFNEFLHIMNSLKLTKYYTPGNHDRRDWNAWPTSLNNYNEIIKPRNGENTLLNDGYGDYSFNYRGYQFIGLDSGRDWSHVEQLLLHLTPEGSGLEDSQYDRLLESDIKDHPKKIIFMHHPVINEGNDEWWTTDAIPNLCPEKGGNNMCIGAYRCALIDYCINYDVQLVLTGHTHQDIVFDGENKKPISAITDKRPLFIQTAAAKDGYYRIIDVKNGIAYPHPTYKAERHWNWRVILVCPATLHAYDSQGRHTGLNASGGIELSIPDSFYIGRYNYSDPNETETISLYNITEGYQIKIVANLTEEEKNSPEIESFNFTIERELEDTRTTITYLNVPLTENTTAKLPINLITTAYTMEMDHNGDGTTDETKDPDLIEINYAPTAAIIAPETGSIYNESEPVMFNGTGRDPEDGILTNFSLVWYSDINGVIGCGERFSTVNLSAGAHTITLFVNDSVDLRDTDSVMVTVVGSTPIPPIANFTYSPENPVVTQLITFNASNSTDPDGFITNYEWDFGDGNITNTTEQIITHSYASAGDYTVNLTVTDDSGATNSTSHLINVISPIGGFSVAILPKINSATAGEACDFTVRLRNTQNFDEDVALDLTLSDVPAEYAADLAWFNWTTSALSIPAGEYRDIGLRMDIPEGISGYKSFGIIAHGTFGDSKDYGLADVTLAP